MDRAHRIRHTKQVYVLRFITEGNVEERMLERAAQELRVGHSARMLAASSRRSVPMLLTIAFVLIIYLTGAANKEALLEMITHGTEKIINPNKEFVTGLVRLCDRR
jgi:SWI/SNF-related matrix-associated actin-dependent regulator of chromatin subfamily A member 5